MVVVVVFFRQVSFSQIRRVCHLCFEAVRLAAAVLVAGEIPMIGDQIINMYTNLFFLLLNLSSTTTTRADSSCFFLEISDWSI